MKKCIIKNCIHCKKKNKRYICVKYSFENLNRDTICFEDVENKIWQNVSGKLKLLFEIVGVILLEVRGSVIFSWE